MVRLIDIPGIRLIERSISSGDEGLIPGKCTVRQYADQIANVHFGTTEANLFPEPAGQDATEADFLRIEALTEKALSCLKGDLVFDEHERIAYFRARGFDITNDERRLAQSAILFTRIIEAGHLGWLNPCPCSRMEDWRRKQMSIGPYVTARPANDDVQTDWVARFGSVG